MTLPPQGLIIYLLGCLFATSCLLWAIAARRLLSRRVLLPWKEREPALDNPLRLVIALLAWIVIPAAIVNMMGVEANEHDLRLIWSSILSGGLLSVVLVSMIASPQAAGDTVLQALARHGISGVNWRGQIRDGAIGFVASLLPVYVVLWLTQSLRTKDLQHSFLQILQAEPGWSATATIALAVIVIAPLSEELLFRVVLQGWLQRWTHPGIAIALVAVLFAWVHRFPDSLALIPLAAVLGYVYYRRHSFLAVVVIHALFNAMNLLQALTSQVDEPPFEEAPVEALVFLGTWLPGL
jgi:membrane protease YdiL (CAAX protease family)